MFHLASNVYASAIFSFLCYGWFFFFIILVLYLYIKNFKPYTSKFKGDFYTQLPSEITPIELSNLMYNKIVPSALAAEIVKLFSDGILKYEKDEATGIDFIVVDKLDYSKFTIGQDYTVKLLMNTIGDGSRVSINQINEFCEHKRNCDVFYMEYNIWLKIMRKENFKHIFFEVKTEYGMVKFVTVLGCILFIANIIGGFRISLGYATFIPAVLLLLYFMRIYKRTREANDEYYKWVGFKEFLDNIDNFEYAIANPDIYVVYGTILGVKGLEKKITKHDYYDKVSASITRCVVKSILNGSRKIVE